MISPSAKQELVAHFGAKGYLDRPEDLKLYIEQFPRGVFVQQAKGRIEELGG